MMINGWSSSREHLTANVDADDVVRLVVLSSIDSGNKKRGRRLYDRKRSRTQVQT